MASTTRTRPRSRRKPPARPTYLRFLIGLVLTVGILYLGKPVIIPLALAVLLTFVLTPLVKGVQRRGLGRVPAVLLVVSLTFLIFGGVGWAVGAQVHKLAEDLPRHATEIQGKIEKLRGTGAGPMSRLMEMFRHLGQSAEKAGARAASAAADEKPVPTVRLADPGPLDQLSAAAAVVLEPAATAGLVLVLVIFMLIRREDVRDRVIGLLGQTRLTGTTRVFVESASRLSRFLLMQLCINAAFGICFGLALLVIGVDYWFLWGFLAVLLRFIPFIGSWVAALLPIVLSFAISPGLVQPLVVLGAFLVLELLTANVVEPVLFGHSTGVSPLALLVAAAFWAWVWGPIGLVLSTPLTVCLVVLGQHVPRLRFLTMLLGDQPALKPDVNYYQRLLAGDAVEAEQIVTQHATAAGADHVPDDVIVPALAMARRDREQAGLTPDGETFILDSTDGIVTGLGGAGDDAAGNLVIGCPSHNKAEELALRMLAGPARPAGCRVQVVPTRTLPVEIEARIEREAPAVLVVAVLPPGGVVQARYLCRRLRRRFADLRIVVCYLGRVRDFDRLLVRLRAAGASYVTTSLLQTRSQIQALLPAAPAPVAPSAPAEPVAAALAGGAAAAAPAPV